VFDDDDAPPAKRSRIDNGVTATIQENQINGHTKSVGGRKKKLCKSPLYILMEVL